MTQRHPLSTTTPHAAKLPLALGDMVASLPVLRIITSYEPYNSMEWHFLVDRSRIDFVNHLLRSESLHNHNVTLWVDTPQAMASLVKKGCAYRNFNDSRYFCTSLRRPLTEQALIGWLDASILDFPNHSLAYLGTFSAERPVQHNRVVLNPTAKRKNRSASPEFWTTLIKGIADAGKEVLLLGAGEIDFEVPEHMLVENKINKTSLLESFKLIQRSRNFVGVDGGLSHVALCSPETICDIYFTTNDPAHRTPLYGADNSLKIHRLGLDCDGCASRTPFDYKVDYRYHCYALRQGTSEQDEPEAPPCRVGLNERAAKNLLTSLLK